MLQTSNSSVSAWAQKITPMKLVCNVNHRESFVVFYVDTGMHK